MQRHNKMEQTIVESFKLAPALVALVAVVYLFIQAQQWMIKNNEIIAKERAEIFSSAIRELSGHFAGQAKTMHEEHMEARNRGHEASEKMALSNMEVAKAIAEFKNEIRSRG